MHVHLDLVGGLAGDMFLAAAIDAGLVDLERLTADLRTLGLGADVQIVTTHARRGAIAGTHLEFAGWDPDADADHRYLSTIEQLIADSSLTDAVKARATALFGLLGAAEAKIHDMPLERVHFHEVGAVDSILDFVSAAWVIEDLGATWSSSAVPAGRGSIVTAHGEIPVPAPAAADLLRGMPIAPRDVEAELVTPTGAAILKGLNPEFRTRGGQLRTIGYGLGTRELPGMSNVVRMMVFDEAPSSFEWDVVVRLQAEVDDMSPELLAHADEHLISAGALDIVRVPVQMKKGRLGVQLSVLAAVEKRDAVLAEMFRHTSTFGIRVETVDRAKLAREIIVVETRFGAIRVKVGRRGAEIVRHAPEYADCAEAARTHEVPADIVYAAALAACTTTRT